MKPGDTVEVVVERLSDEAFGVAEQDGMTLFIYGAVPGDRVRVAVEHISHHRPVAWCRVETVYTRGNGFVSPRCPHAAPVRGRCGGCPAMHIKGSLQGEMKTDRVRSALEKAGLSVPVHWHDADATLSYRVRGHFVPARVDGNRVILGSFAPRSHDVVPMVGCMAVRPGIASVAERVENDLSQHPVPLHPEPAGLRYVTLRGSAAGEVLVELVVNRKRAPWLEGAANRFMAIHGVVGVSVSVNDSPGNAIRIAPSSTLCGSATIREPVGAVALDMAASSFSQLNSDTAAAMYGAAAERVGQASVVWDLYCGLGGLGLTAALRQKEARLYGADLIASTLNLARQAAAREGVRAVFDEVDFRQQVALSWPEPDAILVNPPRRGLDRGVVELLEKQRGRLVYMSCNPESFARDARDMMESNYSLRSVDAYDMLPQTTHVELLGLFEKHVEL